MDITRVSILQSFQYQL